MIPVRQTDQSILYGRTISLYSNEFNSTETTSGHWLTMTNDVSSFGHTNNYIQIPSAAGSDEYDFEIMSQADVNVQFSGMTTTVQNSQAFNFSTKTLTTTIDSGSPTGNAVTANIIGNITIQRFSDLTISSSPFSDTTKNYSFTIQQAVDTDASGTSVTTAQMKMGNSKTWLELNDSTVSKLYGKLGVNIESDTEPIIIRSNRASEGIQIDAIPSDGVTSQGHPYLHLTPQTGGTGDFVLSSGHGTVQSMSNLGNNRAGVQITPGFTTTWGIFSGVINGTTNSIEAYQDIRSGNGWMYAGNFSFNTSQSWNSHGGTYNSASLIQHLAWLYSLVNDAYYRADDAWNRANNAQSRADSAYNLANSANNNANNRVSISTFNSHQHRFSYTKTTVDGKEVVLSIGTSGGAYNTATTTPI